MLGSTACARLLRKLTLASPSSSRCERSSLSAPSGLARRQANGMRDSAAATRAGSASRRARSRRLEAGRDPERQARIDRAGEAAERRTEHEAGAERDAEHAEARRALLRRRHVGDVGEAGRDARRRDAGNDAPDEQPRTATARAPSGCSRGRARYSTIRITGRRPKRSDSAPSIGENRNCISAQAVPKMPSISAARRRVAAHEIDDQARQHRNDDAERQHVEQHGDEDEHEGGAAGRPAVAPDTRPARVIAASSFCARTDCPSRAR